MFDGDDERVLCPYPGCGFNCIHPIRVAVNSGGVVTVINDEGTTVKTGFGHARGVMISIYFQCEDSHVSRMDFQFHKGETYREFVSLGSLTEEHEESSPRTIWRD